MNLAAIGLGYCLTVVVYKLGLDLAGSWPVLRQAAVLLLWELASLALGGYLVARMSGPEPKRRKVNAGLMAILAGIMQLVGNRGGLHWVRFVVMLGYVPAAVWGAERHRP